MVTSSNSVGFRGWTSIIAFVTSIVGSLEIDSGRARVGLLTLVSFLQVLWFGAIRECSMNRALSLKAFVLIRDQRGKMKLIRSESTATDLISLTFQCQRVKKAAPYYFQNRNFNRKYTTRGLS